MATRAITSGLILSVLVLIAYLSHLYRPSSVSSFNSLSLGYGQPVRNVLDLPKYFMLPGTGDRMPSLAFGTVEAENGTMYELVKAALEAGYRHFDCAPIYGTEAEVGRAIHDYGIDRSQVWITSKLWNDKHRPQDVTKALQETLDQLGLEYLDLYLLHTPVAFHPAHPEVDHPKIDWDLTNDPLPTWRAMEDLVLRRKVRNIGVSSFTSRRLANLTSNKLRIHPAVNQVEISYWLPQPDLVSWSAQNNIVLEAFYALGGPQTKQALSKQIVLEVAAELRVTPAQVMLSWHIQRGYAAITTSSHIDRIRDNIKVRRLPKAAFEGIEHDALAHKPTRQGDPGLDWGVDIFDGEVT